MRRECLVAVIAIAVAVQPSGGFGDYLEVDRKSPIRKQPSTDADRVADVKDGDYLSLLDSGQQQNGYYHVKAGSKAGWIYRTFVRRFEGDIPMQPRPRPGAAGTGTAGLALTGAFEVSCQIPIGEFATPGLEIDAECPAGGQGSEGSQAQNTMKNNFCAKGPVNSLTFAQFAELQKETDKLNFPHGSKLPADRSKLRKVTFINGREVGEGSLGRVAGFVVKAHHSNVGKGETVNCKRTGKENNDVHVVVMQSPTDEDECNSLTVEIVPHLRPWFWDPEYLKDLERPVRFTGNLLYDAAHRPCNDGKGSPKRKASWEIHPVYGIDVCEKKQLAQCSSTDDSVWVPLHVYHNLEEDHDEEDEDGDDTLGAPTG